MTPPIARRHALDRRGLLLGGMAAMATSLVHAQEASDTPVRLLVPFTPGTGIDLIARQIAPPLSERLKRPFFVENKPGASGNIGTQEVIRAKPDGTTLLVSVNTLVMNMALYPNLGFNPLTDLAPVSQTSWGQLLLVANPGVGIQSLQGLIARAKAKPGALNYGSPGAGTPHHLAMELFKQTAHVYLTHIPYRGTAPAVTDLLGGQVDVAFLPIHVALPQIKAGKLVALGIGSAKRHPLLPQVPTLAEARAGKVDVDMWYGVFAPAHTPPDVVNRINRELREILAAPEVRAAFSTQGMDPATDTPQEFRRLVERDAQRWAELIRAQGIRGE